MALSSIQCVKSIRAGGRTFNESNSPFKGYSFQSICEGLILAHEMGLCRLRDILRERGGGRVIEIVFEVMHTPAGEAFMKGAPPKLKLSEEGSSSLRRHLERQAETGDGSGPMINGLGEVVGKQSDFMTKEQIMANAREQLRILDEEQGNNIASA